MVVALFIARFRLRRKKKAPFCYGRKRAHYGEVNGLGPDTAPLLCEALRELTRTK